MSPFKIKAVCTLETLQNIITNTSRDFCFPFLFIKCTVLYLAGRVLLQRLEASKKQATLINYTTWLY